MIHQLIFAAPKPGMTEREFQDYWLGVHAVQYASKIPQIRKYAIDTRIPSFLDGEGEPLWSGVAEIWLANEQEQLASLQTDEFLNGARLDEPKWAAFWRTVVLDTDAHVVKEPPRHEGTGSGVKLLRLVKRAEGLPLDAFRERSLSGYASRLAQVPGLRGYLQNHTRDGYYALGEAMLDAVHLMWFDDEQALAAALESDEFKHAEEELAGLIEPRYDHRLVTREHWIIGPDAR
ncbi:EthD domain-containing protein [Streptomyces sp. WELS2]|uniref:EthD domain-containing protein n=1 Tax=Streptomyces sp. WELS2 TaxID=2749435 RepID=UPI0015F0D65E|nr:EthD domain-containing protein [Streptomyces sp. WELS2]